MTTDISFSSSSLYKFKTDSSSSYVSSSHTDHSYVLQPRQTRNLDSLMDILDSHENFKELMGLLDGQMAFQKMLTIDHIHSTIRRMEHEIRKQKARATMLFDDVLHAKKSQRLRMHFKKNHSSRTQRDSPEPLPILPPFRSPSPPPPLIPVPGTPENPIDVDEGTAESPIEILDSPELFSGEESDKEFLFQGRTDPSVVNDWEGQVDWNVAR